MNINRIKRISFIIVLIVLYMICIYKFLNNKYNKKNDYNYYNLKNNWTLSINNNERVIADLSHSNLGVVNTGKQISISNTIPDLNGIISPCVSFKSVLSCVDVYIDDKPVYSYGYDEYNKNEMVAKAIHYIPLKQSDSGKKITITYTATEHNAFSSVSLVYFGNINDVYNIYIQERILPFFVGIFLITFFVILFILFLYLILDKRRDYSIFFSSLISLVLGLYILSYNDILILINYNNVFAANMEYMALYLAPVAILGFIITDNIGLNKPIIKLIFFIDFILGISFLLLDLIQYSHLCQFLESFHLLIFIQSIICITLFLVQLNKKRKYKSKTIDINDEKIYIHNYSSDVVAIGLLVFIGTASFDIISYNFLKFASNIGDQISISTLTIGALTFVIALFINFFFHNIDHINSKNLFNKLENIAYTDELTSLSNRAYSEIEMEKLNSHQPNYTIISIDLDHLKTINDTYGHMSGDRYIANFAKIIKEVFSDALLRARIGGDEFIVILDHSNEEDCINTLKTFDAVLKLESNTSNEFNYQASYGYAIHGFDNNLSTHEIYMLADRNMYTMKQEHHKANKEGE